MIAAILLVLAGGAGVIYVIANNSGSSPNKTTTQQTTTKSTTSDSDHAMEAMEHEGDSVEIKNFAFGPSSITIKKGTTVTWTNKDSVGHTVTPDQETEDFQGSQLIDKDQTYSFTFETAGTYTYHCTPHPQMTGTVVVTE